MLKINNKLLYFKLNKKKITSSLSSSLTFTSFPSLSPSFSSSFSTSTTTNSKTNNSSNSFWNKFSLVPRVKSFVHTLGITDDEDLSNLVAKSVNIGVYSILTMTFLGTVGFDTKPIIASLSVFGFAAGYALKDAATHFAAGIMLVLQKPFQKGDYLKILVSSPYEGIVEGIDVRYVHIRTKDQALLLVPCSIVYGNPLIVSSSIPKDWPTKGPDSPTSTPTIIGEIKIKDDTKPT